MPATTLTIKDGAKDQILYITGQSKGQLETKIGKNIHH